LNNVFFLKHFLQKCIIFFSNVVNLLTNAPPACLDQLLVKSHWCDFDALKVIVNFLDNQLSNTEVFAILIFYCTF